MSRIGKISFFISGFSILAAGLVRTILGGWHDSLYIAVGLFAAFLAIGLISDIKFYKEFFTMRTTKHGMNMGVLILLSFVFVVAVNFLAVQRNAKWDVTEEGLNSLSDQTTKLLGGLKEDLQISFFYRSGTEGVDQARARFKELARLYKDASGKVSVRYVDVIKRPGLAKEYSIDKGEAIVFIDYRGKRNRLEKLDEAGFTTALLKATRDKNKKVYLLTGHGEKNTESRDPAGIAELKKSLNDGGYDTADLNLVDKGQVPEDAEMVMIIGPKTSLLKAELSALRNYARKGGRLFIAADPGERHNLALLVKSFGVEFKNDYVLDQFGQIIGASAAMALGREYGESEITKDFARNMMTAFHLASSLKRAPDTAEGIRVKEIVQTGGTSFTTDQISDGQVEVDRNRRGPHTLAVLSEGKLNSVEGEAEGEFSAVIVGDSDFLSNQLIHQQLNRDLVMNSAAYLLKETDQISIRPKKPKGTTLTMTRTQFLTMLLGVFLPLPLLLFGGAGFIWYRRRSA